MKRRQNAQPRAAVPRSVRHVLRTPGVRLHDATREAMESRFNHDFRHIRVHHDDRAARDVGAAAFTAGRHIVFGAGHDTPRVLAHELTHSSPAEHDPRSLRVGGANEPEEAQAERGVMHGSGAPVIRRLVEVDSAAEEPPAETAGADEPEPAPTTYLELRGPSRMWSGMERPFTTQWLPAGTRVAELEDPQADDRWAKVRVSTGPSFNTRGWVKRSRLVSKAMTEVVTPGDAERLWGELARSAFLSSSGKELPIPYYYPQDGCFARAYAMNEVLEQAGYAAEKVFVVAQKKGPLLDFDPALHVETPYGDPTPGTDGGRGVNWHYHVAPIVMVEQPGGGRKQMVLDPATMKGPVSMEQWMSNMTPEKLTRTTWTNFKPGWDEQGSGRWKGAVYFTSGRRHYSLDKAKAPAREAVAKELTGFAARATAIELGMKVRALLAKPKPQLSEVLAAFAAASAETRALYEEVVVDGMYEIEKHFGAGGLQRVRSLLEGPKP